MPGNSNTGPTTIDNAGPVCASSNHARADCYGDVWRCARCGLHVCCAEGTDDGSLELCDDCATRRSSRWLALLADHDADDARAARVKAYDERVARQR